MAIQIVKWIPLSDQESTVSTNPGYKCHVPLSERSQTQRFCYGETLGQVELPYKDREPMWDCGEVKFAEGFTAEMHWELPQMMGGVHMSIVRIVRGLFVHQDPNLYAQSKCALLYVLYLNKVGFERKINWTKVTSPLLLFPSFDSLPQDGVGWGGDSWFCLVFMWFVIWEGRGGLPATCYVMYDVVGQAKTTET